MREKKIQDRMIMDMAKSSLKSGRMRNFFVMVTLFLSVGLLTFILLFAAGSQEETRRKLSHTQHAVYYELTPDQLERLKGDERIRYFVESKSGRTTTMDGFDVTPMYMSALSDEIQAGSLVTGSLPSKANEAAVTAAFLKRMGVAQEVGSSFKLTFSDGNTEQFYVSGILAGSDAAKNFSLLFSREYAENGSQLSGAAYALYAKLDGAETMGKNACKALIYQVGLDAGMEYKYISPSRAFLDAQDVDSQKLMLCVGVGAVILLACVLVVYGVFYISVIGRIHQFGQLSALGMTQRQIKSSVKREGRILFIRALPAGLLVGAAAGYLIKPGGWSFKNMAVIFVIVIVVNYVITMASVMRPARMAAGISPVEALRYTSQDEMKKAGAKRECRRLSPVGLGFMNFSKNRKKTVITMLSLGLGGIMFMTAATYMSSFNKEQYSRQLYFEDGEYNLMISEQAIEQDDHGLSGIQSRSPLSETFRQTVEALPGVNKVLRQQAFGIKFDYEKGGEYNVNDAVTPMSGEAMAQAMDLITEGMVDLSQMMSGDYVLIRGNDVVREIYGWEFELGDTLVFHFWDGSAMAERAVTIGGFLPGDYGSMQEGWFFMPEDAIKDWVKYDNFDTRWIIATNPEQEQAVGEALTALVAGQPQLGMETLQDRREMDRNSISTLFGAISGLSIFIMMFSILSMMNTLITNIVTKKQELAMLESIGMTRSQRRRMILGECFSLAGVSLCMTLIVGTLAGYGLCRILENSGVRYMSFRFPAGFALIYCAILVLVPTVITIVSMRSFSREALVERLRGVEG